MRKRSASFPAFALAQLEQHGPQTSRELAARCGKSQGYCDEALRALRLRRLAHISGHKRGAGDNPARIYAAGSGADARYCYGLQVPAEAKPVERIIEKRHGTHMMDAIRNAMKSDQPRRIYVGGRLIYSRETGIVEAAA